MDENNTQNRKKAHSSAGHQVHFTVSVIALIFSLSVAAGAIGTNGGANDGQCGPVPACLFDLRVNEAAVGTDAAAYLAQVNHEINHYMFGLALLLVFVSAMWMCCALALARIDRDRRRAAIAQGA